MSALRSYFDFVSRFDDAGLKDAERAAVATAERIKRLKIELGPTVDAADEKRQNKVVSEAIRNADRLAREQERIAQKADEAANKAVALGKAIAVAHIAAKSLAVVAAGIDLKRAFDSGDVEKVTAAVENLKKSITDLPVVGKASGSISTIINDSGAFPFLKSLRDAVARKAGNLTDDEQRELEEQERKGVVSETARKRKLETDKKLLDDLDLEAKLAGAMTDRERDVIRARDRLERYQRDQQKSSTETGLTRSGESRMVEQSLQDELTQKKVEGALEDFFGGIEAAVESAAKAAEQNERIDKAVDDFFGDIEKGAEKRQQGVDESLDRFFGEIEDGFAKSQKVAAERAEELRADTAERDLRTAGFDHEADLRKIADEEKRRIKESAGNAELEAAVRADAESQRRALSTPKARFAGLEDAFRTLQADVFAQPEAFQKADPAALAAAQKTANAADGVKTNTERMIDAQNRTNQLLEGGIVA